MPDVKDYDNVEPDEIPAIVPVTKEQQEYIRYLLKSMLDVVEKKRVLEENDTVFGNGSFFWPKEPQKPIRASLSYGVENFKFRSISIGFGRNDSSSPWNVGGFSIHPRNFPRGFFEMKFSKNLLDGFVLEKASTEYRKTGPVAVINVFSFKEKGLGPAIKLQFEASPTVSDIKDGYPRSFHHFAIFLDQGLPQPTHK